jgi:hypothetical protein
MTASRGGLCLFVRAMILGFGLTGLLAGCAAKEKPPVGKETNVQKELRGARPSLGEEHLLPEQPDVIENALLSFLSKIQEEGVK